MRGLNAHLEQDGLHCIGVKAARRKVADGNKRCGGTQLDRPDKLDMHFEREARDLKTSHRDRKGKSLINEATKS